MFLIARTVTNDQLLRKKSQRMMKLLSKRMNASRLMLIGEILLTAYSNTELADTA